MENKPKNPYRINVKQLARDNGFSDTYEFLDEMCSDSVIPACCKEGCQVEPDGHCEHNCPSPLLALGII